MLLATVLNALIHHGLGVDRQEAIDNLGLVDAGALPFHGANIWLRAQD